MRRWVGWSAKGLVWLAVMSRTDADAASDRGVDLALVQQALRQGRKTPFLLLDLERVRAQARRFKAAIPRLEPHYAVKANPHPAVLAVLIEEGVGFEIASVAELDLLLGLGVAPEGVFYSNPIKSRESLQYAARAGVQWYVLDSLDELRKIVAVVPKAKLYLRIETPNTGAEWPLTGKFGATPDECRDIVEEAARLHADLAGVTFHVGSQCRNLENWAIGIANAKRIFGMMDEARFVPRLLDLGGGYPVHHLKPVPEIEAIGESVTAALAGLPEDLRVIAAPGRFLVSDAGVLVSRVVGTAMRRGRRWVYLDAGVFHGLMETVEGFRYALHTERSGRGVPSTLAGPTCDSLDVMMQEAMLPEDLQEGDYVFIASAGAYSTAYATRFNGFPMPEVVLAAR